MKKIVDFIFTTMILMQIQLMDIYEICYSKDRSKGIIYTIHGIDSPSLMLLKLHNAYEPVALESFRSHLDDELNEVDAFYKVRTWDRKMSGYFTDIISSSLEVNGVNDLQLPKTTKLNFYSNNHNKINLDN